MDRPTLNYEGLQLPETLNYILEQDFWLLDNISGATLSMLREPMKFTSRTAIFVRKGNSKFEINLHEYNIEAPCLVNIASSDIMQPIFISNDFEGAFVVMSERFINNLINHVNSQELITRYKQNAVINIPPHLVNDYELLFSNLKRIVNEKNNPYIFQTVLFTLIAFFFNTVTKSVLPSGNSSSTASHITNSFLRLAQENFKKERFLEFYANELQITPKHLSRTLKNQTGYTACEWLDRFIILEAKVLLKSSTMNIQQIAEELNFPSQSFFGKYFKKNVGVSPKDYRNS